jgi:hypothetical protein
MFSVGPLTGTISELLEKRDQRLPYDPLHSFRKDIADMDASVLTRYISIATFEQGHNVMLLWPLCLQMNRMIRSILILGDFIVHHRS